MSGRGGTLGNRNLNKQGKHEKLIKLAKLNGGGGSMLAVLLVSPFSRFLFIEFSTFYTPPRNVDLVDKRGRFYPQCPPARIQIPQLMRRYAPSAPVQSSPCSGLMNPVLL